jgi:transcriptional regulator with XRE-family HTH domain
MPQRRIDGAAPATQLGELLRYWREARGLSQLELSYEAGISQRQISFIESGRSTPGRQTLLTLAQGLEVPLRERNVLLLAAGYAPIYSEAAWNAQEMNSVIRALDRVVLHHDPFPAVVMDRHWDVLMTNDATPRFFNHFIDIHARNADRAIRRNMLHLMFDPRGLRPYVADWEGTARSLLNRVQHESLGHAIDQGTHKLLAELLAYPGVPLDWKSHRSFQSAPLLPVIPIELRLDGSVMRYFSMITTVGTPRSVAAQELRLESMFPADDATELRHRQMLQADSQTTK